MFEFLTSNFFKDFLLGADLAVVYLYPCVAKQQNLLLNRTGTKLFVVVEAAIL
jgi:hypothetical protein